MSNDISKLYLISASSLSSVIIVIRLSTTYTIRYVYKHMYVCKIRLHTYVSAAHIYMNISLKINKFFFVTHYNFLHITNVYSRAKCQIALYCTTTYVNFTRTRHDTNHTRQNYQWIAPAEVKELGFRPTGPG